MKNQDPSLSTKQRVDAFEHALSEFLRGLFGLSSDDLPSELPRPVKPAADVQKKGNQNDKLSHPH